MAFYAAQLLQPSTDDTYDLLQHSEMQLVIPTTSKDPKTSTRYTFQGETIPIYLLLRRPKGSDLETSSTFFKGLRVHVQILGTDPTTGHLVNAESDAFTINSTNVMTGFTHHPTLKKRMSVVDIDLTNISSLLQKEEEQKPKQNQFNQDLSFDGGSQADIIYKLEATIRVHPLYLHQPLVLAVVVTPSGTPSLDLQRQLVSPLLFTTRTNGRSAHKNILTRLLLETSANNETTQNETPMRQVSTNFRVHQPLRMKSRNAYMGDISCVSIELENISTQHDVVVHDLRFHLSSTRWALQQGSQNGSQGGSQDGSKSNSQNGKKEKNEGKKTDESVEWVDRQTGGERSSIQDIDRAFQAVLNESAATLPLILHPYEKQHFLIRIEPIRLSSLSSISSMHSSGQISGASSFSSSLNRKDQSRRMKKSMAAALLVTKQLTGTFESMVTVAWNTNPTSTPNTNTNISNNKSSKGSSSKGGSNGSGRELLTMRRAVQWKRKSDLKDDIVIEIVVPPIVQHEHVFLAKITIRNLSSTTTKKLMLQIKPVLIQKETLDGIINMKREIPMEEKNMETVRNAKEQNTREINNNENRKDMKDTKDSKGNNGEDDQKSSTPPPLPPLPGASGIHYLSKSPPPLYSPVTLQQIEKNSIKNTTNIKLDNTDNQKENNTAFSLICLQSSTQLSVLKPNAMTHVTVHMLPLVCGNLVLNTIELIDLVTNERYTCRTNCPITVTRNEHGD